MDVWVLWRDTGGYSDWDRIVLGVHGTLAAAQAAAVQDADTYREWWDDDALPVHAVLGAWTRDPAPAESWTAQRIPEQAPCDEMEYTAARFTVQGA